MLKQFYILLLLIAWGCAQAEVVYPEYWKSLNNEQMMEKGGQFAKAEQMDSALACYSLLASQLSREHDQASEAMRAKAIFAMAKIYSYHYYNYQKGADCLMMARQPAEAANDSVLLSGIYSNLGHLYLQQEHESAGKTNELSTTKKCYKKAYSYAADNSPSQRSIITNLVAIGFWTNFAANFNAEMQDYCDKHKQPDDLTQFCRASWSMQRRDYDGALKYLDEAVELSDNERVRGMVLMIKCKLLDEMGRDAESMAVLDEYEKLVRGNGLLEGIPDIYDQKYLFYSKRGNLALAKDNRLKYFESVDSLNRITQLTYLEKIPFIYDLQKATEEIHVQEIQHHRLMQILWIVIVAAIIFMVLALMIYRRNKEIQENYRILYEQNLQHLAIIEEERKKMPVVDQPLPASDEEPELTEDEQIDAEKAASSGDTANDDSNNPVLNEVYQRICAVMEKSPEVYSENFTFARLHELVGSNTKYLSRAISTHAQCDFKTLLSQYRIREACRRMNDVEHYRNFTIDAIAKSVGITSRTSFIKNFKSQTGITPSAYLKLARQKTSESRSAK
ncbi:MAG: helix-turn-helix domain-containing protein [Muribaculaceae bacterium]|nr:helix-turn-helix domain-containing protein [Muribaculaceae bacterium]